MKKPHRQLLLAAGQVCDRNTCFHRIDFWNDCEACGGTSFAEKAIKYNDSLNSAYKEIAGTQQAVANAQVDTVKKIYTTIVDNYMLSVELENQFRQSQADYINDRFSTPEKAVHTLEVIGGAASVVSGIDAVCGAVAAGTSIAGPIGGIVAGVSAIIVGIIGIVCMEEK